MRYGASVQRKHCDPSGLRVLLQARIFPVLLKLVAERWLSLRSGSYLWSMPPKTQQTSQPSSLEGHSSATQVTSKADNYVPVFDNTQRGYKEFRKRREIYKTKMSMAGRSKETVFNIITLLQGKAWDLVDDIELEVLQGEQGYQTVFDRLDKGFKYDPLTELPEDFENFFVRLHRKGTQTLQDYSTDFSRAERQLRVTHAVNLPEKVKAWWYLRKAGLSRDQRQLILTNVGTENLTATDDAFTPWPDVDQDYYGADGGEGEDVFDVEEYDEVYASYSDAKARLNSMRVSRGFYPVVALDDAEILMVETYALDEHDGLDLDSCGLTVQDGGAASVLGSRHSVKRYLSYLVERGFDLADLRIFACKKGFRYGNSQTEVAKMCVLLPVVLGGKKRQKLGITVDYQNKRMRWPGCEWQAIPCGHRGEHQLRLVENDALLDPNVEYSDILAPDDFEHHVDYLDPIPAEMVFSCEDEDEAGGNDHGATGATTVTTSSRDYSTEVGAPDNEPQCDASAAPSFPHVTYNIRGANLNDHKTTDLNDHKTTDLNDHKTADLNDHKTANLNDHKTADLNDHKTANLNDHKIADLNDHKTVNLNDHKTTDLNDHKTADLNDHKTTDLNDHRTADLNDHKTIDLNDHKTANLGDRKTVELGDDRVRTLGKGTLHTLVLSATEANKSQKRLLNQAKEIVDSDQKVIWEVFGARGQAGAKAKEFGAKVETFARKTGWNFNRPKDRRKFLQCLREEQPDEVLLTPVCRLWSPRLEATTAGNPSRKERLVKARQDDHNNILTFVMVTFEEQRRGGRHAHVEHPWESRAWFTKAFRRMQGWTTYVDQCAYGLMLPNTDGTTRPARRPTCYLTTKRSLREGLAATCPGNHGHSSFEEQCDESGRPEEPEPRRPELLDARLARLMIDDDPDDHLIQQDSVFAQDEDPNLDDADMPDASGQQPEDDEHVKKNKELRKKVGSQAMNYVVRLHKSLGHPSPEVLLRMLEEVQATETVKQAAKEYVCAKCYARKKPGSVPPAAGLTARNFNDRVMADSAWVDTDDGRKCILTIMDQATRYVAVRLLHSEKRTDFINGVERAWIKQFGVPKYLRVDEAKGWASQALRNWASDHGVTLEVAPAECHSWLGSVERKHQVVRRAIELFMDDRGEKSFSNLKDALVYIPGQINNMSFVRGFTPNQWVTGRSPMDAASLTADFFNPAADPIDEPSDFAAVQQKRLAAQQAFLRADTDARLRRAMNKTFREQQELPAVGQRCYYWRVQGLPTLQKSKWRGPARVVAHEVNDEKKVTVVWVAHGTNLLRCGPHQVRPVVEELGYATVADPAAAMRDLQDLRARSTTQFRDVYEDEPPDVEDLLDGANSPFYEPSDPGAARASDADDEAMEPPVVPGAVLLYQRALASHGDEAGEESRRPAPRRQVSTDAPAPEPHNVPVPEDDEDLYLDDVFVTDAGDSKLPTGWVVIDGNLAMDEAWLARETSEKRMSAELTSYFDNAVWEFTSLLPGEHDRVVTARWVLNWKTPTEGGPPKAKARLVLRGFQDPDVFDLEKASPTATKQSKFVILALAPIMQWTIFCGDVKTAFLSGANFDRKIIVKLPADCGPLLGCTDQGPTYMRMLKSAYGLADAPLLWHREATRRLRAIKWEVHPLDRCLFCYYSSEGSLLGCLVLHVDDLLVAGAKYHKEFSAALKALRGAFNFGKWEELTKEHSIMYCGGKIKMTVDGVSLSYADYLKKVHPITIPKGQGAPRKLTSKDTSKARGLLGALQWPAVQGLPPLSATVSILAADIGKGDNDLLLNLNKALRFAKNTGDYEIRMHGLDYNVKDLCFLCFSDAAYGVRPDGSSQGGFMILLTHKKAMRGEPTDYNIMSWRSFKLPRVCRSSLSAEAQACSAAVDEMMLLRTMISLMLDPRQDPKDPATAKWVGEAAIVVDAKALYDALKRPGFNSQHDKRTGIEIICIQEELERQGATVRWVSSEVMLADGLTKIGARQSMVDKLASGRICLHFDPNFLAAKKKTPAERQSASDRAYGSQVARKIAQVLAVNSLSTAGDAATDFENPDTTQYYMNDLGAYMLYIDYDLNKLLALIVFFACIVLFIACAWKWWNKGQRGPPDQTEATHDDQDTKDLATVGTQTTGDVEKMTMQMFIGELESENEYLQNEVMKLQMSNRSQTELIQIMRQRQGQAPPPPHPQPRPQPNVQLPLQFL
ncbi:GIP [Symbiodinium sp. CCMP2592]|nr:GIP [Symbiodinium sp. CCMP2592]